MRGDDSRMQWSAGGARGNPTALPENAAWPLQHPVVAGLIWCLAILAIVVPITLRSFRRRTTG